MKKIFHALDLSCDFLRDWWWLLLIIAVCGVGFYASLSQEPYKIITIDGCEYIKSNLAEVPLIHKANCPNHE